MTSTADWLVVAGFLLCVSGVVLRIVIMMRSSAVIRADASPLGEKKMGRLYRPDPKSRLPVVMWTSISVGLILLLAGVLLEFR